MIPPTASRDHADAGTDLPARTQHRYGLRWPAILLAATALGMISSAVAWPFTLALGQPVAQWQSLVILNTSHWYIWALFTPPIDWLSQHFRFERRALGTALLVHIPSVALFASGHILAMSALHFWLATLAGKPFGFREEVSRSMLRTFDWEMVTYWAIVGLSHAVLYYRE
jgi:hypothetical protein